MLNYSISVQLESHDAVEVAIVGLTNVVPARLSYSSLEIIAVSH